VSHWQDTGRLLGRIGRACQWWIGDWLNYGERRYGEKYSQGVEATGLEYQTLANFAWVARRVEPSRRREDLSWGHHAEIAALEPGEQDRLLEQAVAEELSVRELRRARRPAPGPIESPTGTYPLLYADPPWRYEHVPVSNSRAVDELKALKVPAAPDSVLFMWATSPKLAESLELLDAWAFEYRTCMVWVKDRIGMGYYARQQHELLLIARRGDPPMPAESNRPPSVVHAPRAEHSQKPERFYELIEAMYPNAPRLEMFARSRRAGWDSWGNEAPAAETG
jgi:N6-adenosine-specific RNA methylase IME4